MADDFPLGRRIAIAVVAIVALVAGAVAIGALSGAGTEDDPFPASVAGFDVLTVEAAIEVQQADDGRTIAVGGWYQAGLLPSCPAPLEEPALLEGYCSADFTWLMAEPERLFHATAGALSGGAPTGPSLHPMFLESLPPPTREFPKEGDSIPTAVVLVGHFDDPRASDCRDEVRQVCLDRFIVEHVAWVEPGVAQPPPVRLDAG